MKFNDLYLDFQDEELEIKMALESTGVDSKIAAEAAKHYQMGKAQDLVYAEQALASGANFNTVNKIVSSNIKKRAKAHPEFNTKLRQALIKARKLPDLVQAYQAHHIVAKGDQRARRAVEILQALGIDVDDPENGVFLPASETDKREGVLKNAYVHNKVHTKPYYANVTYQIIDLFEANAGKSDSALKQDMINQLREIGDQLQRGTYPIHQFIPGAEKYR